MPRASRVVFQPLPIGGRQHDAWLASVEGIVGPQSREWHIVGPTGFGWYIIRANGRLIARSSRFSRTEREARASFTDVVAALDRLTFEIARRIDDQSFAWWAERDGLPAVVSARWYSSLRDANSSAELCRASLETAVPVLRELGAPVATDAAPDFSSRSAGVHQDGALATPEPLRVSPS